MVWIIESLAGFFRVIPPILDSGQPAFIERHGPQGQIARTKNSGMIDSNHTKRGHRHDKPPR